LLTFRLEAAVRIPLGYWAVDLLDYEPYVSGQASSNLRARSKLQADDWQYPHLVQAVEWANEIGLNVFIDLHGAPGSQNGWEETGIVGPIDFPANSSNSDRALNVLKNLTTEFSKDIYGRTVTSKLSCFGLAVNSRRPLTHTTDRRHRTTQRTHL